MNRSLLLSALWVLGSLWTSPAAAQTVGPTPLLGGYRQLVWQDGDGLPANSFGAIARTPDGYLWFASSDGVVRFDGVRFTTFDNRNTPEIASNNIQALLVDREGALWIGTFGGGLARYHQGRFTRLSSAQGLSDIRVGSLLEDSHGRIWIGTHLGVNVFNHGTFSTYTTADGLPGDRILALTEDIEGGVWVGTPEGLARVYEGHIVRHPLGGGRRGNAVRALAVDRAGDLWVGTDEGLVHHQSGKFSRLGWTAGLEVTAITVGIKGGLWVGTVEAGLHRIMDGRVDRVLTREGLAPGVVRAVLADRDDNVWLATTGTGVVQLKRQRFLSVTMQEGLPSDMVRPVMEDTSGRLWVGTDAGLVSVDPDITSAGRVVFERPASDGTFEYVTGISTDRSGNLWIATFRPSPSGHVLAVGSRPPDPDVVRAGWTTRPFTSMIEDRTGTFWFGTAANGLHRVRNGQSTVLDTEHGLADHHVTALFETSDGAVWIATAGGVSRFKDEQLRTFTPADGFGAGSAVHVQAFYEDADGALWVGTYTDGLYRYANGRFAVIRMRDGLYDNLAYSIVGDGLGNLWLCGNKGIYRVSLDQLNGFADGRRASVQSFGYGLSDGMLSRECNGATPAGVRARDGRLWFPTIRGLVVVDPRDTGDQPPVLAIEGASVEGQPRAVDAAIRISPGERNLEIHYTALSWRRPSHIAFKYQLVGLDHTWVDAGARRTAYFPHLPPGEYTFRVIADNGEGVWNLDGREVSIVVLPPFYQTAWFAALVVAVVLAGAYGTARLRIARVEKERNTQREFSQTLIASQEEERRRIAAELHDSLGQSLLIIKNRIGLAAASPTDTDVVQEQLEELSASASHAIDEVREIAYNLRPYQLSRFGLTRTLRAMFQKIDELTPISTTVEMEAIDNVLPDDAQVHVYRIVQECVNNIVRHSHASEASLVAKRVGQELTLTIRDNGVGLKAKTPTKAAVVTGHSGFGLMGIAERVRIIGGTLDIESSAGTTITIRMTLVDSDEL